jgi:hypothetical protein
MAFLRRRASWWPVLACLVPALSRPLAGQETPTALERQVKAAYLLNFTRYVEWPAAAFPDSAAPVNLCVVGGDEAMPDAVHRTIEGRRTRGRSVRLLRPDAPGQAADCHVVFLPAQTPLRGDWLVSLRPTSALTVGEGAEFIRQGGMISFVILEQTVRFLIDEGAARAAGLRISSRLLALAVQPGAAGVSR